MSRPAILLDCDGTRIVDRAYLHDPAPAEAVDVIATSLGRGNRVQGARNLGPVG